MSYMADEQPDSDEICGYEGQQGPCQNPPHPKHGENGRCWLESHQPGGPDKEPDGRGADKGDWRNVTDALDMPVKRRLELFKEIGPPLPELFEDYYVTYYGKAENETEAAVAASAAVIRDELEAHLLKEGIFYTKQIGDPQELAEAGKDPDEAFVQKPKAQTLESYQDAQREVRLKLKYEGVSGNTASGGGGGVPNEASLMWEDETGES